MVFPHIFPFHGRCPAGSQELLEGAGSGRVESADPGRDGLGRLRHPGSRRSPSDFDGDPGVHIMAPAVPQMQGQGRPSDEADAIPDLLRTALQGLGDPTEDPPGRRRQNAKETHPRTSARP